MRTHVQEGEKVVSANEVNTDSKDEQIVAPSRRIEQSRGRQEERPRKRRKTQEAAVPKERVRRTVSIKLRSPNARARTKMKARRLILEADNNTESRTAASQGRPNLEAGTELNEETLGREKEVPVTKDLRTFAVSPTPLVSRRATRKEKGKAIMTEDVPPRRDQVTSAGIRMRVPLETPADVLAMSSDTEEDPVALEKVVERIVEDVVGETAAPQKVMSPRTSTGTVILETGEDPSAKEIKSQVLNAVDVHYG